jgi:hypothetical protein
VADPNSASKRRANVRPGASPDKHQGPDGAKAGARQPGDHDLTLVSVSAGEVRFRTRLRLKVGRAISYALDTPEGRTILSGQVLGSTVVAIGADGLTFEISVSLDKPFPSLSGPGLAMLEGRGAASSSETGPTLTFVALENDEGPDLDGLLDMTDE